MSNNVRYCCEIIQARDKQRKLKVNDKGYYTISIGAFNAYNSANQYYPFFDDLKKMFEKGGSIRRALDNGQLRGELGHPEPLPGQSNDDFIRRVMKIEQDRVSHHFSEIILEPSKDERGRDIVLCTGIVAPSGEKRETLKAALENTEENVAFSIRSLTRDKMVNGVWTKYICAIRTWDYVDEPGIAVANKFMTPSLEGLADDGSLLLSKEDFFKARDTSMQMGMEDSADYITRVITDNGWESVKVVNPFKHWSSW